MTFDPKNRSSGDSMTVKRSDLGEYWAGLASGVIVGASLAVFLFVLLDSSLPDPPPCKVDQLWPKACEVRR